MRMRFFSIFVSTFILLSMITQQGLAQKIKCFPKAKRTSMGTLYGYYSSALKAYIIQPKYAWAGQFSDENEPIAAVKNTSGEWGYINQKDQVVIPFSSRFKSASQFYNGFASVMNSQEKWGLINRKGELVVEMKYTYVGDCFSGLIPVKNAQNKFGYINPQGQLEVPFIFDRADNFYEGGSPTTNKSGAAFAKVLLNDSYSTVINKEGKYLKFPKNVERGFTIGNDLVVVSVFDKSKQGYMYTVLKPDFTPLIKYSDAILRLQSLRDGRLILIMEEKAIRLNGVRTSSPYDIRFFRIPWESNVSPEDLVVPLISVYDAEGKVIISRDQGYSFFKPYNRMNSVGRAYVIEDEAVARFGFADWKGNEVLKTMYYSTSWEDEKNFGVVAFGQEVRMDNYIEYISDVKRDDAHAESIARSYRKEPLTDKHLFIVDANMKCIPKKVTELRNAFEFDTEFYIKEDYVFTCANVPDMSFVNYAGMNSNRREIIQDGPAYLPVPYTIAGGKSETTAVVEKTETVEKPKVKMVDLMPRVAKRVVQKYEYTRDGLAKPGSKIDKRFKYNIFKNGNSVAFTKEGEMSPMYIGIGNDVEKYLSRYYSWFPGMQHSRNIGYWQQYEDSKGKMHYHLTDWHGNELIVPGKKYYLTWYLENELLWMREIKDDNKDYIWNMQDMKLTPVKVNEKLKMIYQTADNAFLFPVSAAGNMYKMGLDGKSPQKIASDISWLRVFQIKGKNYLLVVSKSTNKQGVMDMNGKVVMPLDYEYLQVNVISDNPHLFAGQNGSLVTYNIETGQSKVLKKGVEFNGGFRRAFGKYGYCKEGNDWLLIDENGNEELRMKLQDYYGQPDYGMAQKDDKWFYVDETGKNVFGKVFDNIYAWHDGLALVWLEGDRNAYINEQGEIVIGPFYKHKK